MIRPHTNHLLLLFKKYVVPQPQFSTNKSSSSNVSFGINVFDEFAKKHPF
jgi:hypothetical protein